MNEMSDEEVFGGGGGAPPPPREMSDADVFGTPQNAPVTLSGAGRAIEEGTQRGVAGMAALPKLLADTVGAGMARGLQRASNWVVDKTGLPESMRDTRDLSAQKPMVDLPTYDRAREEIRKNWGGLPEYQPQNMLERGLTTTGEMLPNVVGPGGFLRGAAQVAYPALGASAAREAGLGPVGEAIGAAYGGIRAGRVGAGATGAAMPTIKEVRDVAETQGYRPIKQRALAETLAPSTVTREPTGLQLVPSEAKQTHTTMTDALEAQGYRNNPNSTPKTHEVIAPLQNAKDMSDYMDARQALGRIYGGKEGIAAQQARQMVETAMEKRMPGVIDLLQTHDQNWNAMRSAEMLRDAQKLVELKAEGIHSGLNVGAKLQQMATNILGSPKRSKYLKPEDKQALEDLSRNNWTRAAERWAGNFLGGGGGLGALAATGLGYAVADKEGAAGFGTAKALGAPLAGYLLRRRYNASVQNQANRVQQQILARSPEAVARGATVPAPPRSSLPFGFLPAYLSQQ